MLQNIHVKNIALIEEIDIRLNRGLNIVTGETGAGKSLIIGSVAVGLGAKVPGDFVTEGESEALIELTFTNLSPEVRELLKEKDIPADDDEVLIQRRITKGRTVNRINFQTVNLTTLREIGTLLIQIHGQHDNQMLLNRRIHIEILDRYAGEALAEAKEEYTEHYRRYESLQREISELEGASDTRAKDIDYFRYVMDEIDEAGIRIGEDEELKEEYRHLVLMKNSYEDIHTAWQALQGSVGDGISEAVRSLSKVSESSEAAAGAYEQAVELEILLQNLSGDLESLRDETDFNEEMFQKIDARIDVLNHLKRKYGDSLENVLNYREELEERYEKLLHLDETLERLKREYESVERELRDAARRLSGLRSEAARHMETDIIAVLEELNFLQVRFEIREERLERFTPQGTDAVEFWISTNVGHALKPLAEVSSGGELSRIMLAIQSVITEMFSMDSMIFDEIDAGISGKTATMVAKRLRKMAEKKQIICITHLPQLAAVGDVHYKIYKEVSGGLTRTRLGELTEEESLHEVARLLGGMEITESALENARELKRLQTF